MLVVSGSLPHRTAISAAWAAYGDDRSIVAVDEVSANVSTNRVYRIHLDDGSTAIGKVSSYGSYFLFYEDHDRLNRCARLLESTRFNGMLAEVWRQPYGGGDRTVDVHLSWLRRKLGETAAEPRYLHSTRGVGVRLAAPDGS